MKERSFFGGTAYLGIPQNDRFRKLVFEGMERYGINYGASRNNNFTLEIFGVAETEAAKRCGSKSSIIVSSGYLAAQLVVQNYFNSHHLIYAPDTHPALWIGLPNSPKITFNDWAQETISRLNASDQPTLIVTNSLNNLFPEIYDFEWLRQIDPKRKVTLLVDDSHGIGITGEAGEGVYSRIPQLAGVDKIVIASMAKAMGMDAGLILGTQQLMENLRCSPVYAGASPPSPGFLYAYVNASHIYRDELEALRANMQFFSGFVKGLAGLSSIPELPIYVIHDPKVVERIAESNIVISSFAYPDPKGKALDRIVLNSRHSKEEIRTLAEVILGDKG